MALPLSDSIPASTPTNTPMKSSHGFALIFTDAWATGVAVGQAIFRYQLTTHEINFNGFLLSVRIRVHPWLITPQLDLSKISAKTATDLH